MNAFRALQLSLHRCFFSLFYRDHFVFADLVCTLWPVVKTFGRSVTKFTCTVTLHKSTAFEILGKTHTLVCVWLTQRGWQREIGQNEKGVCELVVTSHCVILGTVIVDLIVLCFVYHGFCHFRKMIMIMMMNMMMIIQ
jgi:hypothetical protein